MSSGNAVAAVDENLVTCLRVEYYNAFGFQADGLDSKAALIVARVSSTPADRWREVNNRELAQYVREKTGSQTAQGVEWLGRHYIAIDYTEWNLIPLLFQTLIDRGGLYVTPHSKLDCAFQQGERFSWNEMERKTIQRFREFARDFGGLQNAFDTIGRHSAFKKHYNWHSAEGKQFCTELRAALRKKPVATKRSHYERPLFDETCRKYHVLHRGEWSAYEPSRERLDIFILPQSTSSSASYSSSTPSASSSSSAASSSFASSSSASSSTLSTQRQRQNATLLPPPRPRQTVVDLTQDDEKEERGNAKTLLRKRNREEEGEEEEGKAQEGNEEEEERVCLVCLDRAPNTLVLPCMHCVVCSTCSRELEHTNDSKTCIKCRRSIQTVCEDGKAPREIK